MKLYIFIIMLISVCHAKGQTNCLVYKDDVHKRACELYHEAISYPQGSLMSQTNFLESIKTCPTFAPSLYEMAVPYLKRGDFYNWKLLIDKAVEYDADNYLAPRASDLFFFLRDYKKALKDFERVYIIRKGKPGYSVNGDYDLRIVMAMCLVKEGNYKRALKIYNECVADHFATDNIGLFDYLHRGVIYLRLKNYKAAFADLQAETIKYPKLADTYYYIGLLYLQLHKRNLSRKSFLIAKELFTKTGYHRFDAYNEEPDQVYLSDITEKLK